MIDEGPGYLGFVFAKTTKYCGWPLRRESVD